MQGVAVETPAATFIADMVRAHPGEISILALGPLTNIALAMQLDAQLAPQLVSWGQLPSESLQACADLFADRSAR